MRPLGKAISYCQNQWGKLTAFLEDGRLELDNNRAERTIKAFVIGRETTFSRTPHAELPQVQLCTALLKPPRRTASILVLTLSSSLRNCQTLTLRTLPLLILYCPGHLHFRQRFGLG